MMNILDAQIESKFKNGSVDIGVKTLKGKKKKNSTHKFIFVSS